MFSENALHALYMVSETSHHPLPVCVCLHARVRAHDLLHMSACTHTQREARREAKRGRARDRLPTRSIVVAHIRSLLSRLQVEEIFCCKEIAARGLRADLITYNSCITEARLLYTVTHQKMT